MKLAAECFTISYRDHVTRPSGDEPMAEHEALNRVFQVIASEWPHYVIPPGHQFAVLGPDTPCSFFEA
jgi:hypothetical protein